jgi:hypothetical protein
LELHAYQHHVFMDWRFVDDEKWQVIHEALQGAGVESIQAKWEEMFGAKEEVAEEVKVKKPRKKAVAKKKAEPIEKKEGAQVKAPRKTRTTKKKVEINVEKTELDT